MIFQIHWQSKADPSNTEFVVQGCSKEIEQTSPLTLPEWIRQQVEEKRASCPDGWQPVVIWGNHPNLMRAPIIQGAEL